MSPRRPTIRRPTGRVVAEAPSWPDFPNLLSPPRPRATGSATPERQVSAPSTILEQVVPVVYGKAKVPGLCAGWDVSSTSLRMAFVFCYGPQNALTDIEINGEAISGLAWVTYDNTYLGGGSESRLGYMTWYDETKWDYMIANFTVLTVEIALRNANTPGGFQVTAVPTGRKFASFISPYTVNPYTNLAEIAYDIYTADIWKGLTSPADTATGGTWDQFRLWCNETMGDATRRYTFNGKISTRDPDKAIDAVLGAGFASKYFSSDGVVKIWSEAPPEAITGTWTCASGYVVTEDGSVGEATTELEEGDIVYVGNVPAVITVVTDDDTFTVDRTIARTSQDVRLTSGIYLKKDDWASMPVGEEAETGAIPDLVRVRYTLPDLWGSAMYPETIGGGDDKRLEVSVPACSNASMARRISETYLSLIEDQPFSWTGTAGPAAAALEPGDVFFFDTDVLTFQAAKVLPPVSHGRGGVTQLGFRQYDPDTSSDNTQADPTVPTPPTGYASNGTPHFNTINSVTAGGTAYDFLNVNVSNELELGDGTIPIYFNGTEFILKNDAPLRGEGLVGGSYTDIIKIDSNDYVHIGQTDEGLQIDSLWLLALDQSFSVKIYNGTSYVTCLSRNSSGPVLGNSTAVASVISNKKIIFDLTSTYVCQFYGWLSGTGSIATLTNLPNDHDYCIWEESDAHIMSWCFNDGGTIRQIT